MVSSSDSYQANKRLLPTTINIILTTTFLLSAFKMADWKGPAISWALVAVVAACGVRYYKAQSSNKRRANRRASVSESEQAHRRPLENRSKRKKEKGATTSGASDQASSDLSEVPANSVQEETQDAQRSRKQSKKQKKTAAATSSAVEVAADTSRSVDTKDQDEEASNKDFALRLSKAKTGTALAAPQRSAQRVRTEKQSKAKARGSPDATSTEPSGSNSTTGGDADDDLSPALSPVVTGIVAPADTTDVADMLENPAPGPSVLRLTESAQPPRQKQQEKKAAVPELTKKQRQNKARAEARKAEKREAEAARKIQLEKQMHVARQAEREQDKKTASQAQSSGPLKSAWSQGNGTEKGQGSLNTSDSMLDTFDVVSKEDATFENPRNSSTEMNSNKVVSEPASTNIATPNVNGAMTNNDSASSWHNDLSEEEQMKRIVEETENEKWETVPVKGRPKKANPNVTVPAEVNKQKSPFGDGDFEQVL